MHKDGLNSDRKNCQCAPSNPPTIATECFKEIKDRNCDHAAKNGYEGVGFELINDKGSWRGSVKAKFFFDHKSAVDRKRKVNNILYNKDDTEKEKSSQNKMFCLVAHKLIQETKKSRMDNYQYEYQAKGP